MIGSLAIAFERNSAGTAGRIELPLPEGRRLRWSRSSSADDPGEQWQEAEGAFVVDVAEADAAGLHPGYLHLADLDGTPLGVVGPRLLPFEGTLNFRDVGGYRGLDGRWVRFGRVFRSDHLGALTESDHRLLGSLGVAVVIDFRSDAERSEHGWLAHPTIEVRREPIVEQMTEQVTPIERIMRRELTSWTAEDMAAMYRSMLDRFAPRFGAVVRAAAASDVQPLVFHCTAGKDRTGLAAALILRLLGVDRDDVLDDYELTNRYRTERRLAELRPRFDAAGIDLEPLLAFFAPPRASMAGALDHLAEAYGGEATYLRELGGVSDADIERLRTVLLTA